MTDIEWETKLYLNYPRMNGGIAMSVVYDYPFIANWLMLVEKCAG